MNPRNPAKSNNKNTRELNRLSNSFLVGRSLDKTIELSTENPQMPWFKSKGSQSLNPSCHRTKMIHQWFNWLLEPNQSLHKWRKKKCSTSISVQFTIPVQNTIPPGIQKSKNTWPRVNIKVVNKSRPKHISDVEIRRQGL